MGPMWDYNEAFGLCCGFPIEVKGQVVLNQLSFVSLFLLAQLSP